MGSAGRVGTFGAQVVGLRLTRLASAQEVAMSPRNRTTGDAVTLFISLLETHGFHETTVDELARVGGISRATFFRKYGTKEEVVFADHAASLQRLDQLLAQPGLAVRDGLLHGVQLVFRHTLDHAERSVSRHHLLQQVVALRERELSTSHRYERLFRRFLREALPNGPDQDATAVALAASVVAIHNGFLRAWLHDPRPEHGEELLQALAQRCDWLCTTFGV